MSTTENKSLLIGESRKNDGSSFHQSEHRRARYVNRTMLNLLFIFLFVSMSSFSIYHRNLGLETYSILFSDNAYYQSEIPLDAAEVDGYEASIQRQKVKEREINVRVKDFIDNATIHDKKDGLHNMTHNTTVDTKTASNLTSSEATKPSTDKLNILILYPDDWRWNSIGKENPIIKTPFIDSLARNGVHFRKNCVTSSICWLSRATLFSGQYYSRHQSIGLICPHFANYDRWNSTWPSILQRNGYFVGHVGKWQYRNNNTNRFDWSSFHEGFHVYRENNKTVHVSDRTADDAIQFLREKPKDKPWAMTVAFYPPKPVGNGREPGEQWTPKDEVFQLYKDLEIPSEPYNTSEAFELLPDFIKMNRTAGRERWLMRYPTHEHYQLAMKKIYALITQVDMASSQIVNELKQSGEYNNTMIIFTTDNGMFHGAHGLAGKWYPYQESIRVPLVIYDPRLPEDQRGITNEDYTLNIDLASTILGAAGLPSDPVMQGRDMSDLYLPNKKDGKTALEREPWRKEFFYEFRNNIPGYIPSSDAFVGQRYKYIEWVDHWVNYTQLFDMESDPFEIIDLLHNGNVTEEVRSIAAEMKKKMDDAAHSLRDNEPKLECRKKPNAYAAFPPMSPEKQKK